MLFKKLLLYIKIFTCIAICSNNQAASAQVLRHRTTMLMGSRFDITIVADDSLSAEQNIDTVIAEVSRIEHLISDWISTSQVSEVNRNAGIRPVKVDRELFELTRRAIGLSQITNGAFDISFAAMEKVWKFDGTMTEMPSSAAIKKSVERVGYKNIILDSVQCTIFLKLSGMKIGFGSIGKGYAADRGRAIMQKKDIPSGIVNASGDMATWGIQPNGKAWKIGITNPFDTEKLIATIPLREEAVVTSGSYEKYVLLNGKRYSHIINPATGYPVTGLCSVTVFGPQAERANGLSTSVIVLGINAGLELIKKNPQYKCIMITDQGETITVGKMQKWFKAIRRFPDAQTN